VMDELFGPHHEVGAHPYFPILNGGKQNARPGARDCRQGLMCLCKVANAIQRGGGGGGGHGKGIDGPIPKAANSFSWGVRYDLLNGNHHRWRNFVIIPAMLYGSQLALGALWGSR